MKKLLALFLTLFAFCTVAQAKEQGYISVSSEVIREVEPNFAQFNVTVEKLNKNQAKAIEENNVTMMQITKALKEKLGDNTDALKTTSLNLQPRYSYEKGKQVFDTYVATSTLTVSVDRLSQVSELIKIAVQYGATTVNNLNFSLKSSNSYCDEILKQANLENLSKANAVASTLHQKVSGVKYINLSCSQQTYHAQANKTLMSARAEGMDYANASTPAVEKGKIKIYARVDSEFYVK